MRRAVLFALLTLGSACGAQARSPVSLEPLDVPPVPPRVIVPEIAVDEEEVAPPADPVTPGRPSPQRTDAPPKASEKAEPPRTPPEPARTEEAPRVRTPQTANDEQAERVVRSVMGRAQGALQNVNYQTLSSAARQQYDTARRFIAQAENALKIRNYVFARNLADKAETLARQLGK